MLKKLIAPLALLMIALTAEELAAYQRSEIVKWTKVVKDSSAKLE